MGQHQSNSTAGRDRCMCPPVIYYLSEVMRVGQSPAMIRVLLVLAILYPTLAAAQQVKLTSALTEQFSDRVRVSGKPLVGVILSGNREGGAGTSLEGGALSLSSSSLAGTPQICVRARTQGGQYVATNEIQIGASGGASGSVGVAWPTRYGEQLNGIAFREVAALAFAGGCDQAADIIPVLMGAGAASGDLLVYVNTFGDSVTAVLRDGIRTIRRVKCNRLPGSTRVAFDAVCDFGKLAPLAGSRPSLTLWLDQASDDGTQTETLQTVTIRVVH